MFIFLSQSSGLEAHLSDTTASAPGSDDDAGSTAATDGSTLRTSPAPSSAGPLGLPGGEGGSSIGGTVGGAGSESGGSQPDSVSGK